MKEKTKKALLVTRVSGFIPQFESDAVRILQDMGFEVHYAANFDMIVYGKDNQRAEEMGLICHHIPFARKLCSKENGKAYRMLVKLMQNEQFDMVHCHMPLTGVLARMAAKKTKTAPVLYTGHGFHFFKGAPLKNWVFYPVEHFMARLTDGLVTINEEDYQRALHFPVRGKVYRMHGIGLDSESFVEQKTQNVDTELLLTEGLFTEKISLITVGELAPGKNHKAVLMALAKLNSPQIGYYICGEGDCEKELRQLARQLKLEKQVHFLGYRSDVTALLKKADIFVFPSIREGLPVAVMEAMAAGLPVVAFAIRGCCELVEDRKGGRLLEEKDPDVLADALEEMIRNPEIQEKMGIYNQKKIQKYSNKVVIEERKYIYEDVLNG